jgi:hypothetical protein
VIEGEEFRSYDRGQLTRTEASKLPESHLRHIHELVDVASTSDDLSQALSAVRLALAALGGLKGRLEKALETAETVESWAGNEARMSEIDAIKERAARSSGSGGRPEE